MFSILKRKKAKPCAIDSMSCVGKCPVSREYVLFQGHEGFAQVYDEQLRVLFNSIVKNKQAYDSFLSVPHYYFLYFTSAESTPLAGRLIPFTDKSDRRYPFMLYRSLKSEALSQFPLLIPLAYRAYWAATDKLLSSDLKSISLAEFNEKVTGLTHVVLPIENSTLLGESLDIFGKASFSALLRDHQLINGSLTQDSFISSVIAWARILKNSVCDGEERIYRLSIPNVERRYLYLSFWLQLLDVSAPLVNNRCLIYWYHKSKSQLDLLVCFNVQDKQSIDYRLFSPNGDSLGAYKLDFVRGDSMCSTQLSGDSTLFDVLETLSALMLRD